MLPIILALIVGILAGTMSGWFLSTHLISRFFRDRSSLRQTRLENTLNTIIAHNPRTCALLLQPIAFTYPGQIPDELEFFLREEPSYPSISPIGLINFILDSHGRPKLVLSVDDEDNLPKSITHSSS